MLGAEDDIAVALIDFTFSILQQTFTVEQLDIFESALEGLITDEIKLQESYNFPSIDVIVSVDYDPDRMLQEACDIAEMKNARCNFPSKTTMFVYQNCVSLRKGLGNDFHKIYEVE